MISCGLHKTARGQEASFGGRANMPFERLHYLRSPTYEIRAQFDQSRRSWTDLLCLLSASGQPFADRRGERLLSSSTNEYIRPIRNLSVAVFEGAGTRN
jgi:hypothetical protein